MKRQYWQEIEAAAGLLEPGGGGHHGRHQWSVTVCAARATRMAPETPQTKRGCAA